MSGIMRYEFHLFGPRKGQTITINGHKFVKGVAFLTLSSAAMGSCVKVLSRYAAYLRGTQEYNDATERDEANGTSKVSETADVGTDPQVRGRVRQAGKRPTSQGSDDWAGGGDSQRPGRPSGSSDGDGHEDSGVAKFPEDVGKQPIEPPSEVDESVKTAILKLDPDVDEHWVKTGTRAGKPKLDAVEQAYGKTGLDLKDLENAMPGYDRNTAKAAVEAAEPF